MKIKKDELNNKIRYSIESLSNFDSVSIGIFVNSGSRNENEGDEGLAHFLEHMMFKGTKNRTAKELAQEIDKVGGKINASTNKEITSYYVKILNKYYELALEILSDMFFNSLFELTQIEKEKMVVIEEIKRYEDTPEDMIFDLACQNLWEGCRIGKSTLGKIETVEKFTQAQLKEFFKKNYFSENIHIAVAGGIDSQRAEEGVKKYFESFSNHVGNKLQDRIEVDVKKKVKKYKKDGLVQSHICLATRAPNYTSSKKFTLELLNTILGGGMSSRLFQRIREEEGLAYVIGSHGVCYFDVGAFFVYSGTSFEKEKKLIDEVLNEFKKIIQGEITQDEIKNAKEQFVGNFLLSLENTAARMFLLGESLIYYDKVITPQEIIENINKVTLEDIIELAREILQEEYINIVTLSAQ